MPRSRSQTFGLFAVMLRWILILLAGIEGWRTIVTGLIAMTVNADHGRSRSRIEICRECK